MSIQLHVGPFNFRPQGDLTELTVLVIHKPHHSNTAPYNLMAAFSIQTPPLLH